MTKILHIDSDSVFRNRMQMYLRAKGHTYHGTSCGTQAIDMIKEIKPGVIISAINVNGLSGIEIIETLGQYDGKFIFVTNDARKIIHSHAKVLGARDYIAKNEGFQKVGKSVQSC